MALTNQHIADLGLDEQVVEKPLTTKKVSAKQENDEASEILEKQGIEIISTMPEDRKATLGSKSSTLHFINSLGIGSQMSTRKFKDETRPWETIVGYTLMSDEPIEVPEIDILRDENTGINPEDVKLRPVAAGVPFEVTKYEFFYLISRDVYAGSLEANGDNEGATLSLKVKAFQRKMNPAKLPTPTVLFKKGSSKDNTVVIDEKLPDGTFVMKPKYAKKFGALLTKKVVSRAVSNSSKVAKQAAITMALQKVLNIPSK